MSITISPINPAQPDFAGLVSGIDITKNISSTSVTSIENAIDHYGVLLFRNQIINDEQQYAFSSNFGPMEQATGDILAQADRRLSMDINDISNLDKSSFQLAILLAVQFWQPFDV